MKNMIRAIVVVVVLVGSAHAEPVPLPGVAVVSDGCSPCHAGDRLQMTLRIWRPGIAISTVELRATVRTPQGQTVALPVSETLVTLPAGLTSLPLLDAIVGEELAGVYAIEEAILNPVTGVTIDRSAGYVVKH